MIERRHTNDVFVPECKDGATQFGSHVRLDAWAMKRSWAHPLTTGYEIKVSRSDFLRDTKLPAYLDLCNQLYLVCAPGVCDPDEVPEQCGLLIPAKTGSRLFTKRKAQHREIDEPSALYKYVLMSRAVISAYPRWNDSESSVQFWTKWLENRELDRRLGERVGKALREEIKGRVTEAERENERLAKEIAGLQEIKEALEQAGISPREYANGARYQARPRIEEIRSGVSRELSVALNGAISSAKQLQETAGRLGELFREANL